jgi:hypothetical protein
LVAGKTGFAMIKNNTGVNHRTTPLHDFAKTAIFKPPKILRHSN